jgi:hypothetical protein
MVTKIYMLFVPTKMSLKNLTQIGVSKGLIVTHSNFVVACKARPQMGIIP